MKILMISDFRRDTPHFLLNNSRMFSKGFTRNGHDVLEFCYRDMLLRNSPVKSKKWALKLAKKKTDQLLAQLARHYQADIIFIAAFKLLDCETILMVKESSPGATVMCWYSDPFYDGVDSKLMPIAQECQWLLATGAGVYLRRYKEMGIPHCAFLPNPCDPEIMHPRAVAEKWKVKLLFTGKMGHGAGKQDPLRRELLQELDRAGKLVIWGGKGGPIIKGRDYLEAICGAEMAISINAFNDVPKYHSDRLVHYIGCGAFVLCRRVPDGEELFVDGEHLCYFDSIEECKELIGRWEKDPAGRIQVGMDGRSRAVEAFNCQRLAGDIVKLVETGDYEETWGDIV